MPSELNEVKAERYPQTVIMKANGTIVPQMEEVQEYLNAEIIGESESLNGSKYIVTRLKCGQDLQVKVVCLHFSRNGQAVVVKIFPDLLN